MDNKQPAPNHTLSTKFVPHPRPFTVGITGVPGAGKTTFSRALSTELRIQGVFNTVEYIDEYARAYIAKYGRISEVWEQVRIFNKQLQQERRFHNSCEALISDSPVFLGFMYSVYLRREGNQKDAMILSDLFNEMIKLNVEPHYDVILHLPPVLKPANDGIRIAEHFQDDWRASADSFIRSIFQIFPPSRFAVLDFPQAEYMTHNALNKDKLLRLRLASAVEIVRNQLQVLNGHEVSSK